MANAYKVLGQSNPELQTNTTLYTVPAATQAVISTLAVCNRSNSTNYRVAVRPAGATLDDKHYIIYDNYVNQYDSVMLTIGATLGNTDVVTVYAGNNCLSFTLFGSEIT